MARLVIAPGALKDMDRLTDFLLDAKPETAQTIGDVLMRGLDILQSHPLIGRKAEEGYRELVLSHGRSGYLALYRYNVATDTVLVLAMRHQREQGYDLDPANDR
jgi:plasmid stabilization system protein ParE